LPNRQPGFVSEVTGEDMTTFVPPAMGPEVGNDRDIRKATMWSMTNPSEEWTLLDAERSLPLQVTAIDA
jgi:hypothetical protein